MLLHDNKQLQYNNNYHHIITEEPLKSVSEKVVMVYFIVVYIHVCSLSRRAPKERMLYQNLHQTSQYRNPSELTGSGVV